MYLVSLQFWPAQRVFQFDLDDIFSFDCSKARKPCYSAFEIASQYARKNLTLVEGVRYSPPSPPFRVEPPTIVYGSPLLLLHVTHNTIRQT